MITKEQIEDKDVLVKSIYNWIPRKRRFTPSQIELATERIYLDGLAY